MPTMTLNQFNSAGFNNVDSAAHKYALDLLYNGVPNDQSTNLLLRSEKLCEDTRTHNYEHTIEVLWANWNLSTAGNFNKAKKEQDNKSDIKYSDVILVLNASSFVADQFTNAVNRGTIHEKLEILKLVRIGGPAIEDKLKIGEKVEFHKVKFTYYEKNDRTGIVVVRFQYYSYKQEVTSFDESGVELGKRVTDVRLEDGAPGLVI